ncbi:MAG: patatin family protein [Clostridia bacterium]|nr:patatin family protein [Clostridia bacterium]
MKTAIVLEGGASRALFGAGVTDALLEGGIYPDLAVGSSAGIANGVSYISRQKGRALDMAMKFTADKRYMGIKYLFKKGVRSYYNIPFVFEEIPNVHNPFDYDALINSTCATYACVTNIENGKAEYLPLDGSDKEWRAIVATCALPMIFQPVEIDGKKYLDGGIAASVPVDFALEQGCDKVLCVLTRERSYRKKDSDPSLKLASLYYRKHPEFAKVIEKRNVIYNENREHLFDLEKQGRIMIIAPENTEGFSRTEKRPEALRSIHEQGVRIANENIEQIKEYMTK